MEFSDLPTIAADAGLLTFDTTGGGGTLLGFRFVTTTQIPVNITRGTSTDATEIYFSSDWQECWLRPTTSGCGGRGCSRS